MLSRISYYNRISLLKRKHNNRKKITFEYNTEIKIFTFINIVSFH